MLSRASRVAFLQPGAVARLARPAMNAALRPQFTVAPWSRRYATDPKTGSSRTGDLNSKLEPSSKKPVKDSPSSSADPKPSQPTEPNTSTKSDETSPIDGSAEPSKPISSLPDLTKGIPSTLEYEMTGATNQAALSAVAGEESVAQGGGRGRGELPASAYISSAERKRQNLLSRMILGAIVLGAGGVVYFGRNWDEIDEARHPDIPNGWGLGLWWNRLSARTSELLTYYHEPAFEKLLPDLDPSFERPYTLCISLEDMLVHSEWSREHGWRVAKRPGVDYFLRYLSQYYELVLFTTVPFALGEPLVRKLDPYRFIMWPLYREATKFTDGEVVKDLTYLNRDLSKVIIIDTSATHVRNQPENAIVLPKWEGDPKDTELVGLIPFLEYIHTMQYGDVRKVLKSFEGKHIPTEFARREAIARAELQKQFSDKGGRKKAHPSGMGLLGNMLGLKPSNMSIMVSPDGELNPSEAFAQGKLLQDIARERGQRNYEMLEKEIRENGEKWLKEEAALMEKANEEAKASMLSSFTGMFMKKNDDEVDAKPTRDESK